MKIDDLLILLESKNLPHRRNTLYDLAKAGKFMPTKLGNWNEIDVLAGLARYYKTREENREGSVLDQKRADKLDHENELLIRKIETADKLWMRVSDVEHAWNYIRETVKARVTSFNMPAKLKASLLETMEQAPDYEPAREKESDAVKK